MIPDKFPGLDLYYTDLEPLTTADDELDLLYIIIGCRCELFQENTLVRARERARERERAGQD